MPPRKTPVRELKAEETAAPDSPRRRSSRIAAVATTSTPTPAVAKVSTRRSSASETVPQPARITRRLSLSQDVKEPASPMKVSGKSPTTLLRESNLKSTPAKLRARRGSKTDDESSQPTVAEQPAKAADTPRRATRRSSTSSTLEKIQEIESAKPQKRVTRRRSSATDPPQLDKIAENEPDKEKAANMETIAENADEPEETETANEESKTRTSISRKSLEMKNVEDAAKEKIDDEVFTVVVDIVADGDDDVAKIDEENIAKDDSKSVGKGVDKDTEEKETRKSINVTKSPIVEKRQSLEKAKDGEILVNKEETNVIKPDRETKTGEDDAIMVEDDIIIEYNYQELKQTTSSTTPEELKEKVTKNIQIDDEEIRDLDLNITMDQKEILDTSGNSDKENTNNKLNVSKATDTVQILTEKVIVNDQITPTSLTTNILRTQIEESLISSPTGKRKSLQRSPVKDSGRKSVSPAFSVTAEHITDDEAPLESPSKRAKSQDSQPELTSNLENVKPTQEEASKNANDERKAPVIISDNEEDVEVDVVNGSLNNGDDVIGDSDAEQLKMATITKANTPKKNEASLKSPDDVSQDESILVDDDSQETLKKNTTTQKEEENTSKVTPSKSNIDKMGSSDDVNLDGSIIIDDDSQEAKENEISPKKNTSILNQEEETSKLTPSKSNIDNSFKADETTSTIKIVDITPITDNCSILVDDVISSSSVQRTVQEGDKTELNNTSILKKKEAAVMEEDEGIKITEVIEPVQNDKKSPKKSRKSTRQCTPSKSNIDKSMGSSDDVNLDGTIMIDDDSQEPKKSEISPKKNTSILQQEEDTSKVTPSKSKLDNSFKADETKSKIKILDITPITDNCSILVDDVISSSIVQRTVQEDDKTELNNSSISKKKETADMEEDIEDEVIENTEVIEPVQNDMKSPKKSRKSTHQEISMKTQDSEIEDILSSTLQENTMKKTLARNVSEDKEKETVQEDKKTPKNSRKSLTASQLTSSSKKGRKSLKPENNSEAVVVGEVKTDSKKTPAKNVIEYNEEETLKEDKKPPKNIRQSSRSSRKSLKSENDSQECQIEDSAIKTPATNEEEANNDNKTPKKSPKSLNTSQLTEEIEEDGESKKTPKKSRKSLATDSSKKKNEKRKSLKSEDDLIDSEIDESEMAEINEFLGEVTAEDQTSETKLKKGRESMNASNNSLSAKKSKRKSLVEEEFERYEEDDKSIEESTSAKKKRKPPMTVIDTKNGDELESQISTYLKQKADEMFSSEEDSEDDDYKPGNEFIDDMAEEVDDEESDCVSTDSNEIVCEGESLNSSDTETEGDEEESADDDSFICDDEDFELLSGNEDFLNESSPKKKKKDAKTNKSKKDGGQKFSRIVVNNEDSESDAVEELKKEEKKPEQKGYSRIVPIKESDSEDENLITEESKITTENTEEGNNVKQEEINEEVCVSDEEEEDLLPTISNEEVNKSPAKTPVQIEPAVINVDDSDNEDELLSSPIKIDPNESKAGNSSILDTTAQERRKSVRKSSMSVQENISLQDIDDGDLSQRITKVVEWFYTGIKSNADISGNISLNVSLDYSDNKNEDNVTSPGKRRKSVGAIDVTVGKVTSPGKKRKSTGTIKILSDDIITSPPKKRKSVDNTSPSKELTKSPDGKQSSSAFELEETDVQSTSVVECTNIEEGSDEDKEIVKLSSPESTLEITVDRKERVVTRKQKNLINQHDFEVLPFDSTEQLRSIMEFKQLKRDNLDDWNKTDAITKPSTSEGPDKRKRKRSQRKKGMNVVKPSVSMDGDNEWRTETVGEATASLAMPKIKRKKGSDAGTSNMPSFHPKDFKNQVIHSMGRVPRMDTKILLRKRKV